MDPAMEPGQPADEGPAVPRSIWLPAAAWGACLGLAASAAWLGAGAYVTALVAVLPFGSAGAMLHRTRGAVVLTLVLGLALLALLADPLRDLGVKAGTLAGAAAFGALALPLGSAVAHHRRARSAATARPADAAAASTPPARVRPGDRPRASAAKAAPKRPATPPSAAPPQPRPRAKR